MKKKLAFVCLLCCFGHMHLESVNQASEPNKQDGTLEQKQQKTEDTKLIPVFTPLTTPIAIGSNKGVAPCPNFAKHILRNYCCDGYIDIQEVKNKIKDMLSEMVSGLNVAIDKHQLSQDDVQKALSDEILEKCYTKCEEDTDDEYNYIAPFYKPPRIDAQVFSDKLSSILKDTHHIDVNDNFKNGLKKFIGAYNDFVERLKNHIFKLAEEELHNADSVRASIEQLEYFKCIDEKFECDKSLMEYCKKIKSRDILVLFDKLALKSQFHEDCLGDIKKEQNDPSSTILLKQDLLSTKFIAVVPTSNNKIVYVIDQSIAPVRSRLFHSPSEGTSFYECFTYILHHRNFLLQNAQINESFYNFRDNKSLIACDVLNVEKEKSKSLGQVLWDRNLKVKGPFEPKMTELEEKLSLNLTVNWDIALYTLNPLETLIDEDMKNMDFKKYNRSQKENFNSVFGKLFAKFVYFVLTGNIYDGSNTHEMIREYLKAHAHDCGGLNEEIYNKCISHISGDETDIEGVYYSRYITKYIATQFKKQLSEKSLDDANAAALLKALAGLGSKSEEKRSEAVMKVFVQMFNCKGCKTFQDRDILSIVSFLTANKIVRSTFRFIEDKLDVSEKYFPSVFSKMNGQYGLNYSWMANRKLDLECKDSLICYLSQNQKEIWSDLQERKLLSSTDSKDLTFSDILNVLSVACSQERFLKVMVKDFSPLVDLVISARYPDFKGNLNLNDEVRMNFMRIILRTEGYFKTL